MEQIPKQRSFDSWRVLRILSEFVEGFEAMEFLGPSVVMFGSTRINSEDPYYKIATNLAYKIASKNIGIITGGGPGLMEAANKGAREAHGKSCGICITLPFEEAANSYIDNKYLLRFRYFFVRKVMLVRYAQAYIALPGGFGTLDELFEVLTLISKQKIQPFPVYLIGCDYWSGLMHWMETTLIHHGSLCKEDLKIITLTDDLDKVANEIESYCARIKNFENF